jgi:hypothetical protein
MWKIFVMALTHKDLLALALEFVVFAKDSTKDGKFNGRERGRVLSYMWRMVKTIEGMDRPTPGRPRSLGEPRKQEE